MNSSVYYIGWILILSIIGNSFATPVREARNARNELQKEVAEIANLEALINQLEHGRGKRQGVAPAGGGGAGGLGGLLDIGNLLNTATGLASGLLGGLLGRRKRGAGWGSDDDFTADDFEY